MDSRTRLGLSLGTLLLSFTAGRSGSGHRTSSQSRMYMLHNATHTQSPARPQIAAGDHKETAVRSEMKQTAGSVNDPTPIECNSRTS